MSVVKTPAMSNGRLFPNANTCMCVGRSAGRGCDRLLYTSMAISSGRGGALPFLVGLRWIRLCSDASVCGGASAGRYLFICQCGFCLFPGAHGCASRLDCFRPRAVRGDAPPAHSRRETRDPSGREEQADGDLLAAVRGWLQLAVSAGRLRSACFVGAEAGRYLVVVAR
ncbi:hypothetical protein NDU88_002241 [Pleurodeles waltl]|uniref:Uncharacterized protein n=1 Tax=Pleurodeles waltl TaxID=8319 RepID=A0AAV7VCT3_PLEWA|nr:hypothetical protein NDU88_002241 [Pleurodeles waltl]